MEKRRKGIRERRKWKERKEGGREFSTSLKQQWFISFHYIFFHGMAHEW